MAKETFNYEILVIDQSGTSEITTAKSMTMGLSYSEKLWKKPSVKASSIEDKNLGISLHVQKAGEVEDETEAAFILKSKCDSLEKADEFRENLLHHVKDKLGFTNIRVLRDTVSEQISKEIHLSITEAESALRSTLSNTFLHQHGLNWWDNIAGKKLTTAVEERRSHENELSHYLDNDIMFITFDELLELSAKATLESKLEQKLHELNELRGQVKYHHIYTSEDLDSAKSLTDELVALLNGKSIAQPKKVVKKPTAKKAAAPKATPKKEASPKVETKKTSPTPSRPATKPTPQPKEEKKPEPVMEETKVETPAEIDTAPAPKPEPKEDFSNDAFMMITENKLLEELKAIEAVQNGEINIKNFVKDTLARKGYMSGPAFGLAESMKDKGLVNIYETKDDQGFMIKVIKSN